MTDLWYPGAVRNDAPTNLWGSYRDDDGQWKYVLHTTESDTFTPNPSNYFGHTSYPHATIGDKVWQHIPINRAARALKHPSGTVETNADLAVQVEIVWRAGNIAALPDDVIGRVRDFGLWVASETGMPWTCGVRFVGPEESPAGTGAKQRMKPSAWDNYAGICGHQHAPSNDHWDPGAFPIAKLLSQPPEDDMTPEEHDALIYARDQAEGARYQSGENAKAIQKLSDKIDNLGPGGGLSDGDVKRIVDAVIAEIAD